MPKTTTKLKVKPGFGRFLRRLKKAKIAFKLTEKGEIRTKTGFCPINALALKLGKNPDRSKYSVSNTGPRLKISAATIVDVVEASDFQVETRPANPEGVRREALLRATGLYEEAWKRASWRAAKYETVREAVLARARANAALMEKQARATHRARTREYRRHLQTNLSLAARRFWENALLKANSILSSDLARAQDYPDQVSAELEAQAARVANRL